MSGNSNKPYCELLRETGLYEPLEPLTDEEISDTPTRLHNRRQQLPSHPTYEYQAHRIKRRTSDSVTSSDSSSTDSSDGEWPEPIRRDIFTGDEKLIREEQRLGRISSSSKRHRIHMTRRWELEDGRRCRTAFKGRPDLVLKQRPCIPKDAPPEVWLSTLQKEGYELEEVK